MSTSAFLVSLWNSTHTPCMVSPLFAAAAAVEAASSIHARKIGHHLANSQTHWIRQIPCKQQQGKSCVRGNPILLRGLSSNCCSC